MEPFVECFKLIAAICSYINEQMPWLFGVIFGILSYLSGMLVTAFRTNDFRSDEKRFYGILFGVPCIVFGGLSIYFWLK